MTIRTLASLAALTLMLVAPLTLSAQDGDRPERPNRGGEGGRGPGGGGPGGRFGGMGGGMMGGGMMGGQSGDAVMLALLREESVRTELELLPDQVEGLQKIAESTRGQRPEMGNFREMSEEERRAAFEKMRAEAEKRMAETKEKVEEVLLPAQFERLEQIALQVRGDRALAQEDVQKKLSFTEEQKTKVAGLVTSFGDKMREMFSSGDREGAREKYEEGQKQMVSDLLAVLTPEQKAEYDKLKGKPFATEGLEMGRGFGGRGGQGGPGGFGGGRGERGGEGGRGPRGEGGERRRPAAE